jgi:hypothetical protein
MQLAIEVLESRETLMKLKVMDYPNMKSEDRASLHRDLYKKAFPGKEKVHSFDDLESVLGLK